MQMSFFKSSVLAVATACLALAAMPAAAQSYPDKPIRLVVTFAPGGSSDALARAVGKSMSEGLKTTIVVENRPGAGGVIGMDVVKNAAPDGYTILFATNGTHGIGPALYPNRKTDPVKDLAPIGMLHTLTNVLLVHPSVPANNVAELIAYAKANPGKLNFASAGNGSASHLFGELFNTLARVSIKHVPYKGSAPMVTDLLGNQVQVAFDNTVIPHVKAGKLRALAATGSARLAAMPDVPTAREAGLPGYEAVGWMGVYGPRGTPAAVVDRLAAEIGKAMAAPDVGEKLAAMGFQAATNTPAQFDAYLRSEQEKWARVAREARVQPE
ncbi:MAG: tripartite tricarboxylate transporter substrate binding protein [Rhodoferax sp.]|nr:tripartite tricarboxylate transporter substrate binding protein [Rhodoferax sp.]